MPIGDRRELKFERIDEVMPEVGRLLAGHSTAGSWTLGQILHHLSTAIRLSLDPAGGGVRLEPRPDVGRVFEVRRRRFFKVGRFPEGLEVPLPGLIPPAQVDDRAEAESLREALGRLAASEGPFGEHPWLGSMSKPQWSDFHKLHCEHHLGFTRTLPPGR